jgi:ATP-dependent helicase/nuclease subunit B
VPTGLFTIPSDLPFLDALVAGLMAEVGDDPLAVARQTILLPTRRAARALSEAFLRWSGGQSLLLPRLVPVGDVDAEDLVFLAGQGEGAAELELPAVPELRRQLLLTRLVLGWGRARGSGPLTAGQAASLAQELARFLDEVQTEGCDLARLAALVPADHAEHWQETLQFLAILTDHWPRLLAEIGCLDPADRRNRALKAKAEAWRRAPPPHPVVAAGISGGIPGVTDLIAVVAGLPRGAVVLPEVDRSIDPGSWAEIAADPAHPQHLLARLLRRLEIDPVELRPWPAPGLSGGRGARRRLVAEALRPSAESDRWRSVAGIDATALEGLMRLDCPGPQEEAAVIALLLRERLEHPVETAALVTPDRMLARRVAAELRRWGIAIDDSAGVPLNKTPPGVFLRLVLDLVIEKLAPLPLLAALKHPLAAGGSTPAAFRAEVRRLELSGLRGPRPGPGVAGLRAALPGDRRDLRTFVDRLDAALAPLMIAVAEKEAPLRTFVAAHVAAAEALAASAEETGAARLWRDEAGEAAAEFMSQLLGAADSFPMVDAIGYRALFEALLAGPVVRPRYGRHPRLAIWGLLEARLQQADLVILGGLNEGVWPPPAESDPWLSRPMRRDFGLPPPERRIGIAAHDFAQALGARDVVLTRATRIEGAPTVPSRWLLRLDTVLRAAGLEGRLGAASVPLAWQALLDRPAEVKPAPPPEPRPPVELRPRRLSVTQIESWMRDPYAIYARAILRLEPFEPIDADPGAAERGSFIHQALDSFLRAFPDAVPEDAEAQLLAFGRAAFGTALERPSVGAFWWPRFERIVRWFVAVDMERRRRLAGIASERSGSLTIAGPAGPFLLTAKADRIDRTSAGSVILVDYKTGAVPAVSDVAQGFAPQLPLEAAIAAAGGFADIAAASVAALEYWRLSGGDPPGQITALAPETSDAGRLADQALAGLSALVALFDDPRTPYRAVPRPDKAPRYSDYAHLARIMEWSVVGEDAE